MQQTMWDEKLVGRHMMLTARHILHAPQFPLLGGSTAISAAAHPRKEAEAAENTNFQSKYLLEITVS